METKNAQEAIACLDAIEELSHDLPVEGTDAQLAAAIVPLRVLLDRAEALVNGSAEARDRKNAGDRKRRATKKTPGKKRKPKTPLGSISSSSGAPPPK